MSTSSPVRTRQPRYPSRRLQAGGYRFPRAESVVTVVRSILLAVAAISVIGTSNYFAYMIGRKQATYEELRRQVDRVVHLMDRTQVEAESAPTLKPRQDKLEQNAPGLADLTTSTINGKTTAVTPARARDESPTPSAPFDAAPVARPDREARLQPPETSPNAVTQQRDMRRTAHQRGSSRAKVSRRSGAKARQPGQSTTATPASAPETGAAGQ